jgi:twitching motility protein PilT
MLGEVITEGGYYGMQTFDQHLLEHLQAGRITMEDAVRTASSPHDFKLMVAAQSRIGPRSQPDKGEGKIDGAPAQVTQPHPPSSPAVASQPPAAPPVAPPGAPPVATRPPMAPPAPAGPPPGASAPPPGVPS